MAIYTRMGAPVKIITAEQRPRWYVVFKSGNREVYDSEPTFSRNRRPERIEVFDIWWIKAKQVGAYPDGSGAKDIGQVMEWRTENDFVADDGIREIHAECEMKRADGTLDQKFQYKPEPLAPLDHDGHC
jgi:hypothetical protein